MTDWECRCVHVARFCLTIILFLGSSVQIKLTYTYKETKHRLATRLVTSMCHLPYGEKLQRLGLHPLQQRRLRDDLITAFKIFKGLLDIDPNLFFLPPARRGLRAHPFKVLQGASRCRRRGSAFLVRVVKYWNKHPASVVTAPSVNVFKKRLEEVWTEVFPHLPH